MPTGRRVYINADAIHQSQVRLEDPEDLHYLTRVLRLKVGDRLECFDGRGGVYEGRITKATGRLLEIHVEGPRVEPDAGPRVILVQALPKGDRFEWIVQKATELGVAKICPVITSRTVVRVAAQQRQGKRARWQRIAQEAARQCGRATVPQIDAAASFEALVPAAIHSPLVLMPTLAVPDTVPLRQILRDRGRINEVTVVIGPEGDFNREEVARAGACGARAVSLGPLTLRSETAAITTLAIVQYEIGVIPPPVYQGGQEFGIV